MVDLGVKSEGGNVYYVLGGISAACMGYVWVELYFVGYGN
jgi:hypothetical protein